MFSRFIHAPGGFVLPSAMTTGQSIAPGSSFGQALRELRTNEAGRFFHLKVQSSSILLISAVILCVAAPAFGQLKHPDPSTFKRLNVVKPSNLSPAQKANISAQQSSSTIPMWNYSINSPLDGKTYTGVMVGRNPYFNGHRGTTVPSYIVPVKITMPDGTVFDPTANDPCLVSDSVVSAIQGSPVYGSTDWNVNGTDIGTTQYDDAYQRANFWSIIVRNNVPTPYHTLLGYSVLPVQNVTVPSGYGYTNLGSCPYGIVDYNWLITQTIENTLLPSLANQGLISSTGLPVFVFDSVVMYLNGNESECCADGAHGEITNGSGAAQTYVVANYDTSGNWDPDVSILSDEVGKWMDDPLITNATPAFSWSSSQSVGAAGCENILEVGDPSPYTIPGNVMPNATLLFRVGYGLLLVVLRPESVHWDKRAVHY